MKRFIKSTIIVCIILITATSFSQSRFDERRGNPRTEGGPGFDDQVSDAPIDDQIWLGLVAGVLIGGVMYYRRQKKIA